MLAMQTRTRRQREVLDFIIRYIDTHGYEPSYQAIARSLGLRSKAGIAKHVESLEEQGLLTRRRENGSFSIDLKRETDGIAAMCEIHWLDVPLSEESWEDWELLPLQVPRFMIGKRSPNRVFAYRTDDDAMTGRNICAKDIVLVEERIFARDGECVVAVIKKKTSMLREYYRSGSQIELRPANDDFESIIEPADKVEVKGVFRGLLRPVK
ncbi:MAG: transcriptional repressor LexA [Pyrinomonadaceae bacterium]